MFCALRASLLSDQRLRKLFLLCSNYPATYKQLKSQLRELLSVWSYDKVVHGQRDGFLVLGPGTTDVRAQLIPFSTNIVLSTLSFSFESFFFLHEPRCQPRFLRGI